jgi:3-phosphoglycerate kinase
VTFLVRSSLNVPVTNGTVQNSFRIKNAIKTLSLLAQKGARVIVASHIGDKPTDSLFPVAEYLRAHLPLVFVDDVVGPPTREALKTLRAGQILMLQNLRRDHREVVNDDSFSRELASLADVYVNDDFAASHRAHASIVGVTQYLPSYAGIQFLEELKGLGLARTPQSPSLAIVGGAKFATKEPLVKKFFEQYDRVCIAGALANDFFKAQGLEVGRSLVSHSVDVHEMLQNSKLLLPIDVTVDGPSGRHVCAPDDVGVADTIYDVGPKTIEMLAPIVQKARTVVWNGPLGNFEKGYSEMTEQLARLLAEAQGDSVVGGGDTIASIEKLGLNSKFEFVSTAGGAMLDYVANWTLVGIEALEKSKGVGG